MPTVHAFRTAAGDLGVFVDVADEVPAPFTARSLPLHPTAMPAEQVAAALAGTAVEELLWLPAGADGRPCQPGDAAAPAALTLWRVPAAVVGVAAVLDLADAAVGSAAPSLRWVRTVADTVAPLLAAGLFTPAASAPVPLRYRDPVETRLRLWDCPATRAALAAVEQSMPAAVVAAHGSTASRAEVARDVSERVAVALTRQAIAGRVEPTSAGPMTSTALLDVLRGGPLAGASSFPAKTTTGRVLDALERWARQPQPGERRSLALSLLPPATDDPTTDWFVEVFTYDAALPGVEVDLDALGADERAALLAPATAVWAALEDGPALVALPAPQVLGFLTITAPALTDAGVTVVVPDWLRSAVSTRVSVTARRRDSHGMLGLDTLLDANLNVTVDGTQLGADQLAGALATGLVKAGDGWALLDAKVLRRLRRLARATAAGTLDTRALLALRGEGLSTDADADAGGEELADVVVTSNDTWLARLLGTEAPADLEPIPTPQGLTAELYSYQRDGLAWLAWLTGNGFGGVLADDMGLGKTLQVLALLVAEREGLVTPAWGAPGTTLVVVKPSGLEPWTLQPPKFAPALRVARYEPGTVPQTDDVDVLLVTYDTLRRNVERFADVTFDRVVLDEATKVKNPAAAVTRAVAALSARQVLALSGTPVENGLADLHTIVSLANPGLLGSRAQFSSRFASPIGGVLNALAAADGTLAAAAAAHRLAAIERLRRAYGPFYLQRRKADYVTELGLPAKRVRTVQCALTDDQRRLYEQIRAQALAEINADPACRQAWTLRLLTRLQQVCDAPQLVPGVAAGASGKVAALDQILDGVVAAGDKALVFTRFAEAAQLLTAHLRRTRPQLPVFAMTGDVTAGRRLDDVAKFTAVAGPAVFVLTTGTGAQALTLTAATHVVHFDRWWNPAVEDQATDRAYRVGQDRDVDVHVLVTAGTVEDKVAALLDGKRALASDVTGGTPLLTEIAALSLADLAALTALDADLPPQPAAAMAGAA